MSDPWYSENDFADYLGRGDGLVWTRVAVAFSYERDDSILCSLLYGSVDDEFVAVALMENDYVSVRVRRRLDV